MELLFIVLLVVLSLIGVTFIVERGLALRWQKVIPRPIEEAVEQCRGPQNRADVMLLCQQFPSPIARLLRMADDHLGWPKQENVDALQTRARYEVARLERGLVILEIVVGVAPLLGLVGTIYGLIILFGGMDSAGVAENSAIARGIAVALNATLLGLLTAIPALIAWSYYNKKVETLAIEMETLCDQFLRSQYRRSESNDDTQIHTRPFTPAAS